MPVHTRPLHPEILDGAYRTWIVSALPSSRTATDTSPSLIIRSLAIKELTIL
jgi:hypothetical protein